MSDALRDEVVDLALRLIRVDTSNPPGRETAAAELLRDHLTAAGLECELCGPDPERQNLVARLRGGGTGPSLALLAHTDVVPAPAANWTVGPFEGVVREGRIVGRGAADMKGELAARATALAVLAREGFVPAGDVLLIAEADEERNVSDVGLSWLVRERPDLRCDYALNEGGGSIEPDGRVLVSIGEQQVTSLRLRLSGRAGHATVPERADNPLVHLADAVARLVASERSAIAVTPTGAATHEPANVIPPFADLTCDVRAVPGQSRADLDAHLARALAGLVYEAELLEPLVGGTQSPTDTPLFAAIEAWVAEHRPGAALAPRVTSGFTDSHWVRSAWGTVAYGFAPVLAMDRGAYESGMHGADESLLIDDLVRMVDFHLHAMRSLARPA